jgi:hypothetical protein
MVESSIPAALEYLVAQVAALPQCRSPVTVSDGPGARGNDGVVIGVTPDDEGTENDVVYAQLGAQMERETYVIPCEVWTKRSGANAQRDARRAAFVIYNAIVTKVRADRTLGGALHSGAALVTNVVLRQANSPVEVGEGRVCEIRFVVRCENRF